LGEGRGEGNYQVDKIFISGFPLLALVGVNPEERVGKQKVLLDVELAIETHKAAVSDSLADTLDYDLIIQSLQEWVENSRFYLLESMADFLAKKLLAKFPVKGVRLRISKPGYHVGIERVGLQIERGEI
jgi:dihydroneopterin aldolase